MLPYSPRHLPNASPVPVKIAGFSSGKITFQKMVDFFAPNTPAASLQELSIFSSTGCTLLTTKGIPTKIIATVIPILVYAILIPNPAKKRRWNTNRLKCQNKQTENHCQYARM